ncbi:MAG: His/Gly/Thr/Pro-type tRNA ligase C-terminal domain-containing protein, partial [Ruminococcus sp.]
EYDVVGRGLKAQMKYANKIGAVFTMVLGSNELEKGMAKLKEMETGKETNLKLDEKFADNFDSVYIDKMLETIDEAAITLTEAKNNKENEENG